MKKRLAFWWIAANMLAWATAFGVGFPWTGLWGLKEQIKTRGQLRHEVLMEDHERVVLTASPGELRRYLLPYVADDRSFAGEDEIRRIK